MGAADSPQLSQPYLPCRNLAECCPCAGSGLQLSFTHLPGTSPLGKLAPGLHLGTRASVPDGQHMQGTGLHIIQHWLRAQAFTSGSTGSTPPPCSTYPPGGGLQDAVPTLAQSLHLRRTHSYLPVWASRLPPYPPSPKCLSPPPPPPPPKAAPTCQAQGFRDVLPELPDAGSLPAVLGDGAVLYEVLGVGSFQEAIQFGIVVVGHAARSLDH